MVTENEEVSKKTDGFTWLPHFLIMLIKKNKKLLFGQYAEKDHFQKHGMSPETICYNPLSIAYFKVIDFSTLPSSFSSF